MAALTFKSFYSSLKKGDPSAAYYFWGPEDLLKDEAIAHVIEQALEPATRDFNLDLVSASQIGPEEVPDICASLPMMAERRVVVVRGVESWKRKLKAKKTLADYLANPAPETVLVLVQSSTEEKPDKAFAGAAGVEFAPLSPDKTLRWLAREAESQEVQLAPGTAEHLLEALGSDLASLRSEISKIGALAPSDPVTPATVGDLIGVRHGETVYDWRNAVMDGRVTTALELTPAVLLQAGVNGVRLVTTLGTALVGVGLARAFLDQGQRGRRLEQALMQSLKTRVRPFGLPSWGAEVSRWATWADSWPTARLNRALADTLRADQQLKSTRVTDDSGVITDLVLRVGGIAQ